MDEPLTIKFGVESTNPNAPLCFRVLVDDNVIYENSHVQEGRDIISLVPAIDGVHELVFEMTGKQAEHTKIDELGNIVEDAVLTIDNVEFDDLSIDQLLYSQAVYEHDFNGTQAPVQEKFYGSMGCNGRVRLRYECPIYMWLLENM